MTSTFTLLSRYNGVGRVGKENILKKGTSWTVNFLKIKSKEHKDEKIPFVRVCLCVATEFESMQF